MRNYVVYDSGAMLAIQDIKVVLTMTLKYADDQAHSFMATNRVRMLDVIETKDGFSGEAEVEMKAIRSCHFDQIHP